MAKEIERKFIVKGNSWKKDVIKEKSLEQGYIFSSENKSLRIRIANNKAFLTIKGKTEGISRDEFEYEIPKTDAQSLLKKYCDNNPILKKRYYLMIEGNEWTIDEFFGQNKGLVLAEIELESENQEINLPEWIEKEVSYDNRYFNTHLSKHPFTTWEKDE